MPFTEAVVTELREQVTALKLKADRYWNRIGYYRVEIKKAHEERDEWKQKYEELRQSMLVVGNFALTVHFEKELAKRDDVIAWYQAHYQKWGRFYAEYEKREVAVPSGKEELSTQ